MTRRLELVNLSNGDGEDYEVTLPNYLGDVTCVTLKPGERVSVGYSHVGGNIAFTPTQRKDTETGEVVDTPFYNEDGKQVVPNMYLEFQVA